MRTFGFERHAAKTPERLLEVFSAARYNMLLREWEDCFPWTVDRRFRDASTYTSKQAARFHDRAHAFGIEIIPLVQCLGRLGLCCAGQCIDRCVKFGPGG